jgi:hypothetical protein
MDVSVLILRPSRLWHRVVLWVFIEVSKTSASSTWRRWHDPEHIPQHINALKTPNLYHICNLCSWRLNFTLMHNLVCTEILNYILAHQVIRCIICLKPIKKLNNYYQQFHGSVRHLGFWIYIPFLMHPYLIFDASNLSEVWHYDDKRYAKLMPWATLLDYILNFGVGEFAAQARVAISWYCLNSLIELTVRRSLSNNIPSSPFRIFFIFIRTYWCHKNAIL